MVRGTVDISALAQRLGYATDQQGSALAEAQQAERDFARAYAQPAQDRDALYGFAARASESYSEVVRWIGEQQSAAHSIELGRGGVFAKTRAKQVAAQRSSWLVEPAAALKDWAQTARKYKS